MTRSPFCVIFTLFILSFPVVSHTANAQPALEDHRLEVGGQATAIKIGSLESIATIPDGIVRFDSFNVVYCGIGGRFGYNINKYLALEAEGNFIPERNFNEVENSRKAQFLAGPKAGLRIENFGLFVKARPGLMYFSSIPYHRICNSSPNTDFTCIKTKQTNFALDLGAVAEYYPSPRTIIRIDVGDTMIRFKEAGPTQINTSSIFTPASTTHGFQISIGFGLRF